MNDFILWEGRQSMKVSGKKGEDGLLTVSFDRPRDAPWEEKLWFCFDVRAEQYSHACICAKFYTGSSGTAPIVGMYEILPNTLVHYRLAIGELWNRRGFLPVFPGSYKGVLSGLPIDPREVTRFEIAVKPGRDFTDALLLKVYISDHQPAGATAERPIVDSLGQLSGFSWPGKTRSFEEMKTRLKEEYLQAEQPADEPFRSSAYGGFTEEKFEATGWFRAQSDGTRWWLVDPDGYPFFSHGLCYGTRMGEFGWLSGLESFYENAPSPDDPALEGAFTHPGLIDEYVKRHGVTGRSNEWMYNPARGNMIRVFGKNSWWEAWRAISARRFRQWGINTMGVGVVNFSDELCEDFLRISKLPYTVTLKHFPTTPHNIFRDFPDVFDDSYAEGSRIFAKAELGSHTRDRYMIGYFINNEPEWMMQSDCNIAWELLVRQEPLKTRTHLVRYLKERYPTVSALNRAWGTSFEDFETLLHPIPRSTVLSNAGRKDLTAYEQVLIDAFGRIPLKACREIDPHHLCLGMRYANVNDKIISSCRCFDVASFNCYSKHPEEKLALVHCLNKPILIGEWHFGAPDAGMLSTALVAVASQAERGDAYRRYIEHCAADTCCVGAHYFEYNNQTLMGRFDGEHYAFGFIDCTNKPYPHMVRAARDASQNLYAVMKGAKSPFEKEIQYIEPRW